MSPMETPLEHPGSVRPKTQAAPQKTKRDWTRYLKNPTTVIGASILLFWIIVAIIGPSLVPYGINDIESGAVWKAPSANHLLGTDGLGRDILSRLVIGAGQMVTLP